MKIQKSSEDYLETMLILHEKHGYVRSVDIAEHLGVTADGLITLTEQGMDIARRMYTRHKTLTDFLMRLGVDEETAREDACKIEHDLSEQTFNAICEHAKTKW